MIVPVKKAKIFILEDNKKDLLLKLQKKALLMPINKVESNFDVKNEESIVQRATTIVNKLNNYHDKPSFFDFHTIEYSEFVKEDAKRLELLESLENDFNNYEQLKTRNEIIEKEIKLLSPFKDLPYTTNDLTKAIYVSFHLGYVLEENASNLFEHLKNNNIEFEKFALSNFGYPLIFVLDKETEDNDLEQIKALNFNEANLPVLNINILNQIDNLNNELNNNLYEVSIIENKFKDGLELSKELKVLIDQTNARKARLQINFEETKSTVYIEGWVREDQIDELKIAVSEVTKDFDIDISEVGADEVPPTATKNNKFVKQFETITNMFSVPGHNEVDPNPVMSVWYWIIFGIMMGDIGYGLMMILGIGFFLKFKKPKGAMGQLMRVLYYSGYTSVFAGIIFGSMFGANLPILELISGGRLSSFDMMDNILIMLIMSVAIGVLHLTSGLILKVKLSLKHKDPLTALADGVSWISILIGGSIAIIGMELFKNDIVMYLGLALVLIGILLIVTLAGREKKGFFSKVGSSLGGLYGFADYLSDLLSYTRILALALSSSVIAFTMNTLAELVQNGVIGIALSIVVYLIGHVFNFAMGLLSAYVHDSRLQYIEFFGKFYEGGGYEFEPLSFDTKYIQEITN